LPVPLTSSERTAPHAKELSIFYVAALLLIKTCPLTGSYGYCTSVETLSRNAPRPAPAGVNPTAQASGQQETVDACCQGAAASRPVPVGLVGPSPPRAPAAGICASAGSAHRERGLPKSMFLPTGRGGFLGISEDFRGDPAPCRHDSVSDVPSAGSYASNATTADSAGSGSRGPPAARWLGGAGRGFPGLNDRLNLCFSMLQY
jgi:hypothetical protein